MFVWHLFDINLASLPFILCHVIASYVWQLF